MISDTHRARQHPQQHRITHQLPVEDAWVLVCVQDVQDIIEIVILMWVSHVVAFHLGQSDGLQLELARATQAAAAAPLGFSHWHYYIIVRHGLHT